MSKFCQNCGTEIDDNQTVCPNCGAGAEDTNATVEQTTTETANDPINSNPTPSAKPVSPKNIAILAGIIAAIVVVIAIISSIFGSGWKKPIKNYVKGMEKANSEMYLSAFPEFYADQVEDIYTDESLEKALENYEEEYGSKIKMSYKITNKEKIKKDDLQKVQKYIKSKYDTEVKVSKGYKVRAKLTIKGTEDEDTDTDTIYVYKIDGKWSYLDVSPSDAKDYLKD